MRGGRGLKEPYFNILVPPLPRVTSGAPSINQKVFYSKFMIQLRKFSVRDSKRHIAIELSNAKQNSKYSLRPKYSLRNIA